MASQGSDKLKAILAEAREKARVAQAAQAGGQVAETNRVEALLDRNEALPDPRALSRMYRAKDLVERLPDDEDSATPAAPGATAEPVATTTATVAEARAGAEAAPEVAPEVAPDASPGTPAAETAPVTRRDATPARPPLSPAQIREVMNELKEQFTSNAYLTYEAKPNPVDVIPMPDDEYRPGEADEEPSELFYIVGAVIALVVIGVFVVLALNGPLRYRPPAAGPSPSPSASAHR